MDKMFTSVSLLDRGFRSYWLRLFSAVLLLSGIASRATAQTLLSESFDNAFPPNGWTVTGTGTNASFPTQTEWLQFPGAQTGTSNVATPHSGTGTAFYNSWNIGSGGTSDMVTPVLDFTVAGNKVLSLWVYERSEFATDSVTMFVNTTPAVTGAVRLGKLAPNNVSAASTPRWTQYTYNIPASFSTATNYIIFRAYSRFGTDIYLDDVDVLNYAPCAGAVTAGTVNVPASICPGKTARLTLTGATVASGLTYQWEVNSGGTWINAPGTSTNVAYTTPALLASTDYRVTITCTASGQSNTSAPATVTVTTTAPPYLEDFESIVADDDLPGCMSSTGPNTGALTYTLPQTWTTGFDNHTTGGSKYGAFNWSTGSTTWFFTPGMSLIGGNTYQFKYWYVTDGSGGWGNLRARVGTSASSSAMTGIVGTVSNPNNTNYQQVIYTYTCPTTGTYFFGIGATTSGFPSALSIDDIELVNFPPCSGTVTAGAVVANPVAPCTGGSTTLSLSGATNASGIAYSWEKNDGTGWVTITGATQNTYSTGPINVATQYRATLTCTASGATSTSAPLNVLLNVPSVPYFEDFESIQQNNALPNCMTATGLGNTTFTYTATQIGFPTSRINHTPGGSKYASFKWSANNYFFTPKLQLTGGTRYLVKYWYITDGNSGWTTLATKVGTTNTAAGMTTTIGSRSSVNNTSYVQVIDTFVAPTTNDYYFGIYCSATGNPNYLSIDDIEIVPFPPCNGIPVTGTIVATPSNPCLGDSITLTVPGATYASDLSFRWEYNDGGGWLPGTSAPGATVDTNRSFGARPNGISEYRVIIKCLNTGDSAISNSIIVSPTSTTLPYFEDFESITVNNELPTCMKATDLGGTNLTYITPQGVGRRNHTPGGSKYGTFNLSTTGSEQLFITPGLPMRGGITYAVRFWYAGSGTTSLVNTRVVVGRQATADSLIYQLGNGNPIAGAADTNYQQVAYYYTPSTDGVYFVGIGNSRFGASGYLSIDDIEIDSLPPCSGAPNAGNVVSNTVGVCPGTQLDLELTNYTLASNLSFQWTLSNNSGSYAPVGGPASSPYYTTAPLTTSVDTYRVILTCTSSSGIQSDTSADFIITPYKVSIPYTETFESITAPNSLPTCFTVTDINSGTFTRTSPAGSNHTPGGTKYAAFGVAPSMDEWMFTPMMTLEGGLTYRYSFWYRTSGSTPFPILSATVGSGPSPSEVLPVVGLLDSKVNVGTTTYQQFVCLYTPNTTGDYSFGIYTNTGLLSSTPNALLFIDDIQVDSLPKCTDTPNIAVTPAAPLFLCPTDSFMLNAPLATNSGFVYEWQSSLLPNGPFIGVTGTNNTIKYSDRAPLLTTYYRLRTICTFTNDTGYSNLVTVNVNTTQYKPLPYSSDLENWVTNCSNKDVPADSNWLQIKRTGNSTWRRYDQGNTANWTAPTAGAYAPQAQSQLYSARFHSSRAATAAGPGGPEEGTLDMYIDCSPRPGATSPNKALYFYHISPGTPTNALDVRISPDGGQNWSTVASYDSADNWRMRRIPFTGSGANTIIRFAGRRTATGTGGSDIGIDSIFVAPPCNAAPVAGTASPVSPTSICPGDTAILNLTGTSMAGDLQIEWETSTYGPTGPFTSQTPNGRGGYSWTSRQLMQTTWVRAKVTCGGTGDVDSTNVVAFNMNVTPGITYATLPVTENFERWTDRCGLKEIPSANWSNVPSFGNRSWRRNDQGTAGAWTTPTAGQWWPATPTAAVDSYAARFHNSAAGPDGSLGALNLYVNCNTGTPSVKELRFFVNMSDRTAGNTDTLRVLYSLDGGFTFTKLDTIRSTNGWEQKVYAIPSDSSKTIIRFEAFSQTSQEDIGLDYVQVLNPCSGTPVAGTVNPVPNQCPGRTFRLSATGTSAQGGLTYFWESSTTSATTGFNPVGGRQVSVLDTNITQNTWFRLVVACGTGTPLDTSAPILVQLADTFHCYCTTNAQYPYVTSQFKENIGRVTLKDAQGITMMTNGTGMPINNNPTSVNSYSNFQNMTATPLYRDSTYNLEIQQISYTTNSTAKVVGWIDFNRDGIFDTATERIANLTTTSASAPIYKISGNFTVPSNAKPGITGMRITLQQPNTGTLPDPCGTNPGYGETEDYLVDLLLAPCSGFTTLGGGTAFISDTSICEGYPVTLWDTGYQKEVSGVTRLWQQSTNNGVSWQAVGPQNRDSIDVIVQANTRYRFVLLCNNGVQSYSNVVSTFLRPAQECYCPSYADGGPNQLVTNMDSSDIGSFSIGNYTFQVGGPHLINPQATRKWTNNAGIAQTIELWADSTYDVDIYQIMRGTNHKDVKVTMFIDYNHDLQFDVNPANGYPSERVLTAFTSSSNYYLDNMQLTIPAAQVLTTGTTLLRIVMNENTSPNSASDNGCGTYMSGETEDYFVTFRCPTCPTGVQNANGTNVNSFNLFPNPTTGLATVELRTVNAVKEMEMTITNMTGQVIQKRSFGAQGTQFSTTVDLKDQPRGVYFVELKADNERIVRKLVVQ